MLAIHMHLLDVACPHRPYLLLCMFVTKLDAKVHRANSMNLSGLLWDGILRNVYRVL